MRYFDLHCDTLVACLDQNKSLIDNDLHVSVKKGDRFAPYVQCAAVWLPDSVRGAAALQYFDRHAAYFRKMAETGAFTGYGVYFDRRGWLCRCRRSQEYSPPARKRRACYDAHMERQQ